MFTKQSFFSVSFVDRLEKNNDFDWNFQECEMLKMLVDTDWHLIWTAVVAIMERKLLHQRMIDIWSPYLKCQGICVVACLQCSNSKLAKTKKTSSNTPSKTNKWQRNKTTMNDDVSPTKTWWCSSKMPTLMANYYPKIHAMSPWKRDRPISKRKGWPSNVFQAASYGQFSGE